MMLCLHIVVWQESKHWYYSGPVHVMDTCRQMCTCDMHIAVIMCDLWRLMCLQVNFIMANCSSRLLSINMDPTIITWQFMMYEM